MEDIIGLIFGLVYLAVIILQVASIWIVFSKAGEPGWMCLIPFLNLYVLLKIAGKPGWWLLLMLVPFVNIIIGIMLALGLAESFGKGAGFAIGLIFLPFIFYPILAFGSAQYVGASA